MSELMDQGLNLALVGMGVVFTFLTVLVVLTTLMSRLLALLPEQDTVVGAAGGAAPGPAVSDSTNTGQTDQRLVAVISAAIRQHRRRH